jgi:hypothetical protein
LGGIKIPGPTPQVEQYCEDQDRPPQWIDAQEPRAVEGERAVTVVAVFFMQHVADEKPADHIEQQHGPGAVDVEHPGGIEVHAVRCEHLLAEMLHQHGERQKQPDPAHAPAPSSVCRRPAAAIALRAFSGKLEPDLP